MCCKIKHQLKLIDWIPQNHNQQNLSSLLNTHESIVLFDRNLSLKNLLLPFYLVCSSANDNCCGSASIPIILYVTETSNSSVE